MKLARREAITQRELPPPEHRVSQEVILAARRAALALTLSDPVAEYIAALVDATRRPEGYSTNLRGWLRWGASPRAAIAMERGARALAWLDGRDFVTPEDVQEMAPDAAPAPLYFSTTAPWRVASPWTPASRSCWGKYRPHDRAKPRRAARTTRSGAGLTVTVTTARPRFTRGNSPEYAARPRPRVSGSAGRMSAVMTRVRLTGA